MEIEICCFGKGFGQWRVDLVEQKKWIEKKGKRATRGWRHRILSSIGCRTTRADFGEIAVAISEVLEEADLAA